MFNKKRVIAGALLSLGAGAVMAADNSGWYGGISVGRSDFRQKDGGVDAALANQGFASTSDVDKKDTGFGLNLGYQINPFFAVEGGYVNFGKLKYNANITSPVADTASGELKADGWTLSGLGIAPLGNDFSAYGRLGVIRAKTEFSGGDSAGIGISDTSHTKTSGLYGVGLNYDINKSVATRIEWTRYANLGDSSTGKADVDLYSVGLNFKF